MFILCIFPGSRQYSHYSSGPGGCNLLGEGDNIKQRMVQASYWSLRQNKSSDWSSQAISKTYIG